ncbi:heterokaryon incompatibility protein-domain-containing protein [Podospora fimiseda]|uniref:Heterokaryon incompatibility protein-domain-containing protein n=1 Tax=Podospora fimiseda TaxID=252190 RepID=A0AAN6YSB3_9PEZI|nr:heterokaryon incompatibility protein-domain-containing protein [Podospora fimiseda]
MSSPNLPQSPAQLYADLPLPPGSRSIRVLDLDTASDPDSDLTASIGVAVLDESLHFLALSYVWGSPTTTPDGQPAPSILLRDLNNQDSFSVRLNITPNCQAALKEIRNCARTKGVSIWVDAICINQGDDDEKVDQIPLMQDIYSFSSEVAIWLGDGNSESDLGMDYLNCLARWGQKLPLSVWAAKDESGWKDGIEHFERQYWDDFKFRLRTYFSPPRHLRTDINLDQVLNREWSHRSWTFQEIILARQAFIICGHKIIDWGDLASVISILSNSRQNHVWKGHFRRQVTLSPAVLIHWRSIIELWFAFPRKQYNIPLDGDNRVAKDPERVIVPLLGQNMVSFEDLFHTQKDFGSNLLRSLTSRTLPLIIGTVGVLIGLVFMPTLVLKIIPNATAFWKAFTVLSLLAVTFLAVGVAAWWREVSGGRRQIWIKKSSSGGNNRQKSIEGTLDGIRTGLRERNATMPQDKTISISGMLTTVGATPSAPNYKTSVEETYRTFVQDLVKWLPAAMYILMDAGGEQNYTTSWLPDWTTPRPSAWLTSKYKFGMKTTATALHKNPHFQILPSGALEVKGGKIGRVVALTEATAFSSTEGLSDEQLESVNESNIAAYLKWHQIVKSKLMIPQQRHERWTVEALQATADRFDRQAFHFVALEGMVRSVKLREYEWPCTEIQRRRWSRLLRVLEAYSVDHVPDDGFSVKSLMGEIRYPETDLFEMIERLVRDKRNLFMMESEPGSRVNAGTKWFGSGPLGMMEGDEIFVLRGIPTPMALRRIKTGESEGSESTVMHKVIGAVLVDGWMVDTDHEYDYETFGDIHLV